MREVLVVAALKCLTEDGFSRTTVSNICARAGVSRGALLHHFPKKNDVIVAAYVSWLTGKLRQFERWMDGKISIRDEVCAWRKQMEDKFAITHEFYWALRNDDDLCERFGQTLKQHDIGSDDTYSYFGTELDASPASEITRYVINCFVRGLCFQMLVVKDSATIEKIFEHFIDIVTQYILGVSGTESARYN